VKDLLELSFRHNTKRALGFEIFKLSELFARADALPTLFVPKRLDFHCVYLGIRGNGRIMIDFAPVPLGKGRLTVAARGRVQLYLPQPGCDAWMLLIAPEFVADRLTVLSPLWQVPTVALSPELLVIAEQMVTEHARPEDEVQAGVLASLLRVVLLRAERLVPPDAVVAPELARFFTILERDCLRTREVAHYAKAAGISPRRLGELVTERTGRSTKQLIDERVILEHKRLLAHTELTVKELADRTGFAEPTNLVKFFRHHTGTTPAAFRDTFLPSRRRS
jgi:AraC-like DNA-binding protein